MRTVYADNLTGSASPTDPTQSNDAYNSWPNLISGESGTTDDLTVICSGTDLGAFDTTGLSCNSLTVNMEADSLAYDPSWVKFTAVDASVVQARTVFPVRINGLVAEIDYSTSADRQIVSPSNNTPLVINKGFLLAKGGGSGELRGVNSTVTADQCKLYNVIIANLDNFTTGSAYGLRGSYKFYNGISYNNRAGAQSADVNNVIKNSVFGGNEGGYGDLRDSSGDIDYNAGEDADIRGANGVAVTTVEDYFVDAPNNDFTLTAAGDAALGGVGFTDPAAGDFSDDITGTAHGASWSIGPKAISQVPTISAQSVASNTSQVDFVFTTTQTTGNAYVVYDTVANMSGITASQIKAGNNANDVAAFGSASVAVDESPETIVDSGLSLTIGNTYTYAIVHNVTDGDSNITTGTFTVQGLNVSSVTDPIVPGSVCTIAVTDAETTEGSVTVTDADGTVYTATITAWPNTGNGDGNITFTMPSVFPNDMAPGAVTVTVQNSGQTASDSISSNLSIDTGYTLGTVVSQDITADDYIDTSPETGAPVSGDLIGYESLLRLAGDDSQTAYTVTVNLTGLTYSVPDTVPAGDYYFDYYIYDQSDDTWGAVGRQTLTASSNVDITPDQFDLGANVTGAELNTIVKRSVTVAGADGGQNLTVTATGSAEVSADDNVYSSSVIVQNGFTFWTRLIASPSYATVVTGGADINGISDSFSITTRAAVVPTITQQPSNQSVSENNQYTFSITASNASTYQWYDASDDSAIAGATSAQYTATAALSDNAKQVYCIVTSSEGGTVQSNTVTLTVTAGNDSFWTVAPAKERVLELRWLTARLVATQDNDSILNYWIDLTNHLGGALIESVVVDPDLTLPNSVTVTSKGFNPTQVTDTDQNTYAQQTVVGFSMSGGVANTQYKVDIEASTNTGERIGCSVWIRVLNG